MGEPSEEAMAAARNLFRLVPDSGHSTAYHIMYQDTHIEWGVNLSEANAIADIYAKPIALLLDAWRGASRCRPA